MALDLTAGPDILPDDGNYDRPHVIKMEYCGSWGYKPKCVKAIEKITEKFGDIFTFMLYMDEGTSGRLEITAYFNQKNDQGDGEMIFSKA